MEQDHRGGRAFSTDDDARILLDGDVMLTPTAVVVLLLQDPGRSAGFHPSGSVLAVGTMSGRLVTYFLSNLCFSSRTPVELRRFIGYQNSNIDLQKSA